MGCTEGLAPFARSLGLSAQFVLPEGPGDRAPPGRRGRAWWPQDTDGSRPHAKGPRDLSEFVPHGLSEARRAPENLLESLAFEAESRPIFLGGFPQGPMLSCALALRTTRPLAGPVLSSGTRISHAESRPLCSGPCPPRAHCS